MSSSLAFFLHQNGSTVVFAQDFHSTLPFPLCLPYLWRVLVAECRLLFVLIFGLRYRQIMFKFLCNSDTRANPINRLIYIDLLSGTIFGFVNLLLAIAAILMTNPLSVVFNKHLCILNKTSAGFSIHGSYIWTCLIAICRIAYIKAQSWMKNRLGENNLFVILCIIGLSTQTFLSLFTYNFDDGGLAWKICTQHSQVLHTNTCKNL